MRVLDEEVFLAMLRLGHYTTGNRCVYVHVCEKNVDVMQNLQTSR